MAKKHKTLEDCGSPPGYERLLEALADPENKEYGEHLDWLDEAFDPEAFDLAAVNEALESLQ
ncbi:MAG: hypothetical protein WCB49_07140 [Gammaproteobacteria bacterium]